MRSILILFGLSLFACSYENKQAVNVVETKENWQLVKIQDKEFLANTGDILLEEYQVTMEQDGEVLPTNDLIGGKVVDPKDFPASVYSLQPKGSDSYTRCTATVVGDRALLLAAHCVGDGKKALFTINQKKYESVCSHAPDYKQNYTADWAMCAVTEQVEGIKFESVNVDQLLLKIGDEILLTGFGCLKSTGGGNDGKLRAGEAKIIALPKTPVNDIVTRGKVALCFGDSGGGSYKVFSKNKRVIVSVNSRGNIEDTSYLSSTSSNSAVYFFKDWSQKNSVLICGIHGEAERCR